MKVGKQEQEGVLSVDTAHCEFNPHGDGLHGSLEGSMSDAAGEKRTSLVVLSLMEKKTPPTQHNCPRAFKKHKIKNFQRIEVSFKCFYNVF